MKRELLGMLGGGVEESGNIEEEGMNLPIEDLIPKGKADKPFWARGADVLGYSFNGLRFAHFDFVVANRPIATKVVNFQLDTDETQRLIAVSHFSSSILVICVILF